MAKAKKRADGRYKASFTYQGRRYYCYGSTDKEARRAADRRIEALEAGEADHDNPTMTDYYKHFTDMRRGKVRESTLRIQGVFFENCARIILYNGLTFGRVRIQDIKPADLLKVQAALQEPDAAGRVRSARTVNDTMAHVKHVFNTAIKEDYITKNPCRVLLPVADPRKPARETKHRALTQEETSAFFQAATERNSYYLPLFRFAIQTGARIGEIAALTAADITPAGVKIHSTVARDEIGRYYIEETTKTKAGARVIPVNRAILEAVRQQKEILFALRGSAQPLPQLFISSEGGLLREYTANREIMRICSAAGIEKFTMHAFRATFATRFIEQRPQDYKALSELLGHSNTKITLDLYTHVMESTKRDAMNDIIITA